MGVLFAPVLIIITMVDIGEAVFTAIIVIPVLVFIWGYHYTHVLIIHIPIILIIRLRL